MPIGQLPIIWELSNLNILSSEIKIRFFHLLRTLADVAIDCISPSSRNMQECIFGKNVACAHLGSFEHERVHAAKSN